jgi:outer membrane protein OmpA-like peptidoglycan-associated protein
METPATPDLPDGAAPLQPPPIRDTLPPSPALKPPAIDNEGNLIPGNHFILPSDVSTILFNQGSENIDPDSTPVLDKLSAILQANTGVRITLTAYAQNSNGISPREARRLSLSRALAIRDYLTTKGISSGRIDVRALGANAPADTTLSDKVDIKAN